MGLSRLRLGVYWFMHLEFTKDNVFEYTQGIDENVLSVALGLLRVFGCCPKLLEVLESIEEEHYEEMRIVAEALAISKRQQDETAEKKKKLMQHHPRVKPSKPVKSKIKELHKLQVVIGFCPKCGSKVVGEPMPTCESEKTKRTFYKECVSCDYFSEIFQVKGNRYKEVEGG